MRVVWTVLRYELGIWRSLAVWLLRLRRVPAGATAFSYAGVVTPLFIVFIAVSAIELPVLHLLLPVLPRRRLPASAARSISNAR